MSHSSSSSFWASLAIGFSAMFVGGCQSYVNTFNDRFDKTIGPKHEVLNVHRGGKGIPKHIKRVAVLPMYLGEYDHIDLGSVEAVFQSELSKRLLFEVVPVSEDVMHDLFEINRLSSVGYLPTKLLGKLHTAYAIDGVMLLDLTYFRAYQPVGVGVRAKLLDGHTGELVWGVDEVFDSANPAVENAARKYFKTESALNYPLHETRTISHSPTRFSKYVASSVFDTIYLRKR